MSLTWTVIMMSESKKWKRRERALAGGIILWAVGVSAYVILWPEQLADQILTMDAPAIAGIIMVTIGFAGGFVETCLLAASQWSEPSDPEGLTEVPWDE